MISVTAPGKMMIAGEYSVLGPGGEALAVAVAPGLEVTAEPAEVWSLGREDTGETWERGPVPAGLRFVHAALEAVRARYPVPPQAVKTRLLGEFGVGDKKPGVGGSASVTSAAVAALLAAAGLSVGPDAVCELAVGVHLDVQGGAGSGYDVATIVHGGLVRWRPARLAGTGRVSGGEATRLAWPARLKVLAGYTGQSASTTGLLAKLAARIEADRAGAARAMARLAAPVAGLVDAFVGGDVDAIMAAVRRSDEALRAWDRIGVVTPAVAEMIALAREVGAEAKVSGAGGGDSVLAFCRSEPETAAVSAAWKGAGYLPLPFKISELGTNVKKSAARA